jgi:hypothetical protein
LPKNRPPSYTAADYAKTRDSIQASGMKILDDDGKQARLAIGNTMIVARTRSSGKPMGLIDHIGYAVDLKDKNEIFAEVKKHGFKPEPMEGRETGVHVRIQMI